jgi:hypothetical protein
MRNLIDIVEAAGGPFVPEILYHGSLAEFTEFDRSNAVTAQHIYTSPDIETAKGYGPIIYKCRVRGPQADLTDDGDYRLIARLVDEFADRFVDHVDSDEDLAALKAEIVSRSNDPDYAEWEAEEEPEYKAALLAKAKQYALDFFMDGKIYDYDFKGRFQDEVLGAVFDWGYSSLRFIDYSLRGAHLSVVANLSSDIEIIGRV